MEKKFVIPIIALTLLACRKDHDAGSGRFTGMVKGICEGCTGDPYTIYYKDRKRMGGMTDSILVTNLPADLKVIGRKLTFDIKGDSPEFMICLTYKIYPSHKEIINIR